MRYGRRPILTQQQRVIAWRLAEQRCISAVELADALYGDRIDGGPNDSLSMVRAHVCNLRKTGIRIACLYGRGYLYRDEDREHNHSVLVADLEMQAA
jgi:hypothetical protein